MNQAGNPDPLADAARIAQLRAEEKEKLPEPSLASRLGQIGMLGWMIVLPTLFGTAAGRLVDRHLGTGVTMTAALLMVGVGFGFWIAWRWMHRP